MKRYLLVLVLAAVTVSACKTTRITSTWKAPGYAPVKYSKVLVVALSQPDNNLKQKMEQHLVGDLSSHGISAISAYQQYGPKGFDEMDEKGSLERIQNTGVDAILTIVLLDKSKERDYVNSHIFYTPYAIYYNRFWGYYTTLYTRLYTPGYYVTNTAYFWESNLYDATSRQLIYSIQTKSFNPDNSEALAHEYGRLIVDNMVKEGVIGNQ